MTVPAIATMCASQVERCRDPKDHSNKPTHKNPHSITSVPLSASFRLRPPLFVSLFAPLQKQLHVLVQFQWQRRVALLLLELGQVHLDHVFVGLEEEGMSV